MSKRKNTEVDVEQDEDDDKDSRDTFRQQVPQKVYDFHKKTIEVYPQRLHELNQEFLSSISSQIQNEPYSVLVGNCLDYVRQYFTYEDDLLQYSPWLATRLKQSRSDIVKCLQETIDVYEALARHDFDRIIEKNVSQTACNGKDRPPPPPTTSSVPTFNFPKATTTTATTSSDSTISTAFSLSKPTATTIPTSSKTDSTASFDFKLPSTATTSPEKTTNAPPFSFSLPNTGFGTSTFSPPNFGTTTTSAISFATPPKFSFAPTPAATNDQPGATEDNDDEASEPPEPEKVEHESDAKLTYRCRMGVSKGSKLVKRGPVQVVVKENNDKRQLIVRSDDTLGRLYLNILWSKLLKLEKNSSKDLTFACQLNPGMTEIKEGEFVKILFRFDNETERNDAYEKLDQERT